MVAFWDKFKRKPRRGAPSERPGAQASRVKETSASPEIKASKGNSKEAPRILVAPLLSEKASRLAENRQYVFKVVPSATRIGVARAVAALYGVRPASVNILRVKGKRVRFGRVAGREKDWKKAVVTLPPGKRIAVYEGV
ncbi:50S ribosomal protein L23 [Patescibacteria group bacterium]|nr:MAG: 50S ribosomal protein L23 [Patescibacteria group bacterium]